MPVKSEGSHILVVDDDPGTLDFLSDQLGSRGFRVETALSGGQAVSLCQAGRYDLVLCDLKMSLMDGIACMEKITHQDPSLQVIMISGEATVDKAVLAVKKGAYDFLQKPLRMESLLCLIEKAMLKSRMESVAAVYERSRELLAQMDPKELLQPAIQSAASYFRAEQACWMRLEGTDLVIVSGFGIHDEARRLGALEWARAALRGARPDMAAQDRTLTLVLRRGDEPAAVFLLVRSPQMEPFSPIECRDAFDFAKRLLAAAETSRQQRSLDLQVGQLRKLYSELEESKNLLAQKEKLARLGQAMAQVAHEVNSPLSAVMGYAELLYQSSTDETSRQHLALIQNEAERCARLMRDLLNYARASKPRFRWVQMHALTNEALQILMPEIMRLKARVDVRVSGKETGLYADPDQLKQVLINLLKNAFHALRARADPQIEARISSGPDKIRISVSDNGCGIRPENLGKIFEPYFTTKPHGEGTGIGLGIVADILRAHHGKISVQSVVDKGTEFVLELPVNQPDFDSSLDHAA